MTNKRIENEKVYYFIGIGGISMSGLASYLLGRGHRVFGSDAASGEQIEKLRDLGAQIAAADQFEVERFGWISASDIVVYTDAIPFENKELVYARERKKTILSRVELLQEICKSFSHVAAVAGSHGKTTCTAMCAHVFWRANVSFCSHIGGEDLSLGNFWQGGNEYFVTEACEYKKNLLKIPAEVVVLLNVDRDHMECYADEEDLHNTFRAFCGAAKVAVVCMDDSIASTVDGAITFSLYEKSADYRAAYLRQERERYAFSVYEYGLKVCRIHLQAVGRHNVYNALAAFALMRTFGFSAQEIKKGLESFQGVKRRFEELGRYRGAEFVADYAHHPREILSAVRTARRVSKGRLFVVFQPHTYSRTKELMGEFVEVLRKIQGLVIYKTFPARESFDADGDGKRLAENVGGCLYADSVLALRTWLNSTIDEGDFVLFLGAGDIYYLAKYLASQSRG